VEVVAYLPPPLLSHLRIVVGGDHDVAAVERWEELDEVVRLRPVDVAIIDPRTEGSTRAEELRALLERYPSLPVVVYTALVPEALKATVELAKHGVQQVVLRGFDDEPRRFRELIDGLPAYTMGERVLAALAPRLAGAPPELARAIERAFRAPHTFQDVRDLAIAAGMTRRRVDRWLDRIGLASARMLVVAARLIRAYHFMRDPGRSLDDIWKKLGYGGSRLFIRQVKAATGLTPSLLRESVGPEDFVAQLTARLCSRRRSGDAAPRIDAGPRRGRRADDLSRAHDRPHARGL
jgi:AraC-like DNA-binding protein